MSLTHAWPVRVYYEDTDAAGVVYHANYLRFAERARSEMLRAAGTSNSALIAARGAQFAVRRCTMDFRAPARLDEALVVTTRVVSVGGARVEMAQTVRRDDTLLVGLDLTLVMIGPDWRATRIPPALRALMLPSAGSGE